MNIAILGFGTIGSGVYEIIQHAATDEVKNLHVTHILIRKGKDKTLPIMCDDIQTIFDDPQVDLIVETIGGIEPAHTHIMNAIQAKKHVVTANKAVVAKYLKDFNAAAVNNDVHFYYEASTGGGIPWIQGLEKALRIDAVDCIHGIFNGTSNYILDHMYRYQATFDDVLKDAQHLGYAEADPSADIDGFDISNKIRISASIAYNHPITDQFPIFGIRNILKEDVQFFSSKGFVVKLIAKTKRKGNTYDCIVEPMLFGKNQIEANIQENYNLISLHGDTIGELKFYGQGAGKLATANAVIQDIIDISENKSHRQCSFNNTMQYDSTLCNHDYILRCNPSLQSLFKELEYEPIAHSYFHIKHVEATKMHAILKEILECDPTAFMASIYEEEQSC